MSELEEISLGILVGVGLVLWLLISAAMSDRRPRKDEDPPKK